MRTKTGKRLACLLLAALLLPLCAAAENRVFRVGETEPFEEGAEVLTVRFAPLTGGDCILVTVGGKSMFVDVGTDKNLKDLQDILAVAGLDRVDYLYNTHPHCDHIGGFMPLARSGFPIGALITFFPHDYIGPSIMQRRALITAEEWNVPVIDMKTEERMELGGAELISYRLPDELMTSQMGCNDKSAMLMIRYGDCSILLTGDVELRAQELLVELYDLKADIMKIPHHAAAKTNQAFMDEVDAECVVLTGGSVNTEVAQAQIRKQGTPLMAFAGWGYITLQTDGKKWIVKQEIGEEHQQYVSWFLKEAENKWLVPKMFIVE